MNEIDRKAFLRTIIAPFVGIAAGTALVPISLGVEEVVEQLTGNPAGNADIQSAIESSCQDKSNPEECVQNFKLSGGEKDYAVWIGPVFEEAFFRGIPSTILSTVNGNEEDALGTLVCGTGGMHMTRRELGVGIVSSVLFGAVHNFTIKGEYDSKTIPAPLAVGGLGLWYLQRKLGFLANTAAHITNNFIAVSLNHW